MQLLVGTYVIYNTHAEYFYDDITVFLYTLSLCMLIMRLHLSTSMTKLIRTLAPLTLGVYIIHPFVIDWVIRYMSLYTILDHCLCFVVVSGVSFLIVYFIYKIPVFRQLVIL